MTRDLDFKGSLIKERTEEETKAALMAFDALQAAQSKIDILSSYLLTECRKVTVCAKLPMDRQKAIDLGLSADDSCVLLVAAVDAYVREFKAKYGTDEN